MAQLKCFQNLDIQAHVQECFNFMNLRFMYVRPNLEVEGNASRQFHMTLIHTFKVYVHKSRFPNEIFLRQTTWPSFSPG